MTDAEKAQNWLRELKMKVGRWQAEDYRDDSYSDAIDEILALTKPEYIINALSIVNIVVAQEATSKYEARASNVWRPK